MHVKKIFSLVFIFFFINTNFVNSGEISNCTNCGNIINKENLKKNKSNKIKNHEFDISSFKEFRKLEFQIGRLKYDSYSAFTQGKNIFGFYAKGILFYGDEICKWKSNVVNTTTKKGKFRVLCPSGLSINGQYTYYGGYSSGSHGSGFDSNGRKASYKMYERGSSSFKEILNHYNQNFKFYSSKDISIKPVNDLKDEERKTIKFKQQIRALRYQEKISKISIDTDDEIPIISISSEMNSNGIVKIYGKITDNLAVSEALIDNYPIMLNLNGDFETEYYVPRAGKTIEIVAFDIKGNKSIKNLKLQRNKITKTSGPNFSKLNPSIKKVKTNSNSLALIIGIENYKKLGNAIYADNDAQQFYDYATMKLGIPSSNIKELVNEQADLGEILINIKDWLRRSSKPNKTDIYIYFAGHGLASENGSKMYLLPFDGRPRLLENTALTKDKLFNEINKANPKSVTVFLDTCYSGTTRGTDMLIASRPIAIKALEQSIPSNFTVFSAAAGDQTSKPLEEAKHGMFSYFLMKGMEGDADSNNDKKITALELHNFVRENVVQQSSGSQTPELQGDRDKVLVQFN